MKKIINVLWTGGLESSCRIVELSRQDVIVQPYYVIDPVRDSIKEELKAIGVITRIIRDHQQTIFELRDVKAIEMESIGEDKEITAAWERLHEKYQLGSQYDWLARFAKQNHLTLEMGLESSPRSKSMNAIKGESKLLLNEDEGVSEYHVDCDHSTQEAVLVFGNLRFPSSLWNMTKLEEAEEIKNMGLGVVLGKTWFCHTPVFGMTCGHCNPCKDALYEGMAFRVSKVGFVLGAIREYLHWPLRIIKKGLRKIVR